MSDHPTPADRRRDRFDERMEALLHTASADAPNAPSVESFNEFRARLPAVAERRRRRWATGGAIGLAGAAAAVSLFVIRQDPVDTIEPADVPEVISDPTTTISPTTTTPTAEQVAPTAVLLTSAADGFDLDYAVSPPNADGREVKQVRYRDDRTDSAALELTLRGVTDEILEPFIRLDRQTWDVNGRTVYDANELDGCGPDACSVMVQWDETTNVSVAWSARPGTQLAPEQTIDALVDFVGQLAETDADEFRPSVVADGPTISQHGVLVAGRDGVRAFDGWNPDPQVLTTTPSTKAIGLPDGRVLVQTESIAAPGELFIVDPSNMEQTPPVPYWPGAIPDDGSVSVDIEDAATLDGNPTLLLEVHGPDGATLELASIDATSEPRRVVADFPDASPGTSPTGFVDIDLRDVDAPPAVGGMIDDSEEPVAFFASLDGRRDDSFEELVSGDRKVSAVGFDSHGLIVSIDDDGTIRIRDQLGAESSEIAIRDKALADEVGGSRNVEPILLNTFPVTGSVWVQSAPEKWVEIGADGTERNRVDGIGLTGTNQ